jgi:hypothetical protein
MACLIGTIPVPPPNKQVEFFTIITSRYLLYVFLKKLDFVFFGMILKNNEGETLYQPSCKF